LKKAYYKIVFKYHPDNKVGADAKELCNKQMMVINAAYKVLRDKDLRAAYDEKRRLGLVGARSGVKERITSPGSTNKRAAAPKTPETPPRSTRTTPDPPRRSEPVSSSPPEEVESLSSILSEMWADLRLGGGSSLLRDLEELLDPSSSSSSFGGREGDRDPESELRLVDSALSSTSEHCAALQAQLAVESALLAAQESQGRGEGEGRLKELQDQLRRKEAVAGLRARLVEAQGQVRQLQRQRQALLGRQAQGQVRQPPPPPAAPSKQDRVEEELQRLKAAMKPR